MDTTETTTTQRKELTVRQMELLNVIKELTSKFGYPPSYRDISDGMRGISTNAVSGHLNALEKKGHIKRNKRIARSIIVL